MIILRKLAWVAFVLRRIERCFEMLHSVVIFRSCAAAGHRPRLGKAMVTLTKGTLFVFL